MAVGAEVVGSGEQVVDSVEDWATLAPKRAYVLRSPAGEELLAVFGGPAGRAGGATFFAHAPGFDGELTLRPGDGWMVLRRPESETGALATADAEEGVPADTVG